MCLRLFSLGSFGIKLLFCLYMYDTNFVFGKLCLEEFRNNYSFVYSICDIIMTFKVY